jgi:hypothetical protein
MKNLLKKTYPLLPLLLALPVYADDGPPKIEPGGKLSTIIDKLLGYLFPIAGVIALIFIIQGGYMWIISGGDPSKVKQAQGTLTWAILGLVIVMIIFGVLRILIKFLS